MNTVNTHRSTVVFARLLVAGLTAFLLALAVFPFSTGSSQASILRPKPTPTPSPTLTPSPTPSSGTWTTTGSLNHERYNYTATLLQSGQVLVAGGEDNVNYTTSAELYTPSTGTWTYTGSLHNPRSLHTAALLSNGKVLVSGGILCTYSTVGCNLAELYTP